jgi:hypothetical protein
MRVTSVAVSNEITETLSEPLLETKQYWPSLLAVAH